MARPFTKEEIEQLKRSVPLPRVCAEKGIELKRHGKSDYIGRCPFHDDKEPSFIVTPGKNLFHCMGCDTGGSVIDFVMKLDGVSFLEAVETLLPFSRPADPHVSEKEETPPVAEERFQQLLDRALSIYGQDFSEHDEGKDYLHERGISDAGLLSRHGVGYCAGRLFSILPDGGAVREELERVGIVSGETERFAGCVVFAVRDVDGRIVTLYGRRVNEEKKRHFYLPGRPTGLWNVQAIKTYPEIILVESVIDALSVEVAGFSNVVSIQSTNGMSDADLALFKEYGVSSLLFLLDGDPAGQKAAQRLKEKCSDFRCEFRRLPEDLDPNGYLQTYGAEALAAFIQTQPAGVEPGEPPLRAVEQEPASSGGVVFTYGLRTYRILGLEKGKRKLRATVRVEQSGRLHVDTLDFYNARARRVLAQDLCRIFEETPETLEADMIRLLRDLEETPEPAPGTGPEVSVKPMSSSGRKEAEAFGRSPDLMEQILFDYEACGLVGEAANKLLGYVAMTSRKREVPLSVLVLSSSGAGKTALQDAAVAFCPPEDLVKLTSLSGKALFYKEQSSLKHKVLALEEGAGAEEASYAIRNLISSGALVIESTVKDLSSGRLTTMENRVEGPTSVFITTTNPEIDAETKSRFFVTAIDESREQTRAILAFQRKTHTSDDRAERHLIDATLNRHRNFQRLLKPLAVKNPFADQLTYGDDRLQGRRDQPKYLNLIKAVAFLRQMQKETESEICNGHAVSFITVDRNDIQIANKLAHEILGQSLDELSRPGRNLLMLLDEMVEGLVKQLKKEDPEKTLRRTSISFSRREIRESSGWTNTRLHTHLKELVDFEYLLIETGRNGMPYRYRLAYEGQGKDGAKFVLGLTDPEELNEPSTEAGNLSPTFQAPFTTLSATFQVGKTKGRACKQRV